MNKNFLRILYSVMSLCLLQTSSLGFSQPLIQLIEHIGIRNTEISIGQIAHIDDCDQETRQKIASIVVDNFQTMDTQKVITAYKIKQVLAQAQLGDITVKGLQSRVYMEYRTINQVALEQLIEDWVKKSIPANSEAKIQFSRLPPQWKVPASEGVSLEISSSRNKLANNVNLTLRAVANRQALSTVYANVNINLFREAPVLTRSLNKGEIVTEDCISMEQADVTHVAGMEIANLSQVIGKMAKKDLAVGSLVCKQDFTFPILIERGSINQIVILNGDVQMNVVGAKAMDAGKKGDMVLFTNPINPRAMIYATVVQPGLAVIQLS